MEGRHDDDPGGGDQHEGLEDGEGADEDHRLGDEAGESGQPERGEEGDRHEEGVDRYDGAQPPEPVDLAVMGTVVSYNFV